MGAVPKRKISKGRKNRRRAHDGLTQPAISTCPKCNQAKQPHFRCEHCGHYGPAEKSKTAKTKKPATTTSTKRSTKKSTKKQRK